MPAARAPRPMLMSRCSSGWEPRGWPAPVEVSLKLSAVGQALDQLIALDNARRVCAAADAAGTTVTLDMEDHTTTDSTLGSCASCARTSRGRRGAAGLPAPHRGRLPRPGRRRARGSGCARAPTRSRRRWPYQDKHEVDRSYVRCLKVLMAGEGYPMVATHDPRLVDDRRRAGRRWRSGPDSYEYQMLYGIRPDEQRRLAAAGAPVRVYVPYGDDWYGYLMRRLAERPANLMFFLRSVVIAGRDGVLRWSAGSRSSAPARWARRCCPACCAPAGRPTTWWSPQRRPERAEQLRAQYGVAVMDNAEAAKAADIAAASPSSRRTWRRCSTRSRRVVAARPAGHLGRRRHPDRVHRAPARRRARRSCGSCPTRPVLVDEAMSAISAGAHAGERAPRARPRRCCGRSGATIRVPESQQDAVTALSGTGPAYFFYLVEAMIDAGILLGLPRAVAADLIVQTAIGVGDDAARLRRAPGQLREAVTSPAGTTIIGDPRAGEARRPGRPAGRARGRPRPVGRAGRRARVSDHNPCGRHRRTSIFRFGERDDAGLPTLLK